MKKPPSSPPFGPAVTATLGAKPIASDRSRVLRDRSVSADTAVTEMGTSWMFC
jgi:hypothetical protein